MGGKNAEKENEEENEERKWGKKMGKENEKKSRGIGKEKKIELLCMITITMILITIAATCF